MTRAVLGAGLALWALAAACTLDFVAPEPASPVARLTLDLDLRGETGDSLAVQGRLDPGSGLDGVRSEVPDPRLVVLGIPLAADSAYAEERLALAWDDVVITNPGDTTALALMAPEVSGRDTPPPVRVSLRRPAAGSVRGLTWSPGEGIVLPLRRAPEDDGRDSDTWNLTLTSWDGDRGATSLVSLVARTPIRDSVRIPADWLPDTAVDSLSARIRYTRTFSSVGADGTYSVSVTVNQTLSWLLTGSRP